MDTLELLNLFKRHKFHICRVCGHDEISFKYDRRMTNDEYGLTVKDELYGYYCEKCYESTFNHKIDNIDFDMFDIIDFMMFNGCEECEHNDVYGKIFYDKYDKYARVCKRCMTYKLIDNQLKSCLIKPAKR